MGGEACGSMFAMPDEYVRLHTRRHGAVLARPLAQALVVAGAGGALLALPWALAVAGAALVAAGAAWTLRAVWDWERTRLVVTTHRLVLLRGTLRRRASAVLLTVAASVELEQSLLGQLFGYGTVVVGPLRLDYVADPKGLCRMLDGLAARGVPVSSGEAPAAPVVGERARFGRRARHEREPARAV